MAASTQTIAFHAFSHNLMRLNRFLQFARDLDLSDSEVLKIRQEFFWQSTGDEIAQIRAEVVVNQPNLETDQAELLREITRLKKEREEGFVVEQLGQYHRLRDELALIQLVAIADGYRTEATALLFRKKTAALVKHKVEIVKVLSDVTAPMNWDELYDEIIRVAVNNMTRNIKYKGWIEKIKNDFSLALPLSGADTDHFEEIIATRNVLVHNSGLINKDYQDRSSEHYRRIGQTVPALGTLRQINQLYCTNAIQCFERVIHAIDAEVHRVTV